MPDQKDKTKVNPQDMSPRLDVGKLIFAVFVSCVCTPAICAFAWVHVYKWWGALQDWKSLECVVPTFVIAAAAQIILIMVPEIENVWRVAGVVAINLLLAAGFWVMASAYAAV